MTEALGWIELVGTQQVGRISKVEYLSRAYGLAMVKKMRRKADQCTSGAGVWVEGMCKELQKGTGGRNKKGEGSTLANAVQQGILTISARALTSPLDGTVGCRFY